VWCENPRKRGHAWARKVVALFAEDPEAGTIAVDGNMLDPLHLTVARRLLGVGPA
jgi:citrate lyase subunit beta / citryl-CoA lyase